MLNGCRKIYHQLRADSKALENLKPGSARQEIAAGDSLYFILQPSGSASWAVRYRVNSRLSKLTLGAYPRLGLGEARKLARKARASVDAGGDPQGEQVAARRAARVAADFDHDRIETVVAAFLSRRQAQVSTE